MKTISVQPRQISPVTLETHDEILHIYDSFNEMVDSIQRYQDNLSKSEELIDKINNSLLWIDSTGLIKHANAATSHILEIEIPSGENIWEMLDLDITKLHFSQNKCEISPFLYKKSDKLFELVFYSHLVGTAVEYFAIISDITAEVKQESIRERMELELIRINRLSELGRRIQGVVHNLNNPLNSMMGYVTLLENDRSNIDSDLERIGANIRNMSTTIKQLLYKTRDDSIAMPAPININNLIEKELSFCAHDLFYKHEVELTLDLYKDMPELNLVYGDISQVFQTLFNNAMDAMVGAKKKVLTVTTYTSENHVVFSMEDTGCGIETKALEKLFEIGFTTKKQTEAGGFGIGLALVKAILDKIQGKIEVETVVGEGTKFVVKLENRG
jgi:signal transduction histidine kinase